MDLTKSLIFKIIDKHELIKEHFMNQLKQEWNEIFIKIKRIFNKSNIIFAGIIVVIRNNYSSRINNKRSLSSRYSNDRLLLYSRRMGGVVRTLVTGFII